MAVSRYIDKALQNVLDEFARVARPGNIDTPLFTAAVRCYELINTGEADLAYAESELIRIATDAGHDAGATRSTMRSAQRKAAGRAATIPASASGHAHTGQGCADLAAYAAAQGSDRATFAAAGWSDSLLYEYAYTAKDGTTALGLTPDEPLPYTRIRRALRLTTEAGPRWRLIDEDKPKPKYWHPHKTHLDSNKAWYKIGEALALAAQVGYLALCNGEASTVVAQACGVPAACETGGGEKATPSQLLQMLRALWQGPILIALDGDARGRTAGLKKLAQYRAAGYTDVRALELGDGLDLATFCKLHQAGTAQALPACPDLPDPSQAAPGSGGPLTQSQAIVAQLAALGYAFRLNLCGHRVEMNGEPINDIDAGEMRSRLRDAGQKLAPVEDAITAHAKANAYHAPRDYLNGLAWDGQNHIARLADCMHGTHPIVTYADGQICPLHSVYLHRWLIGVVAKVCEAAQNAVLTFTGAQNLGKSSLAAWLCPPPLRERYFVQGVIDPHNKDHELRLLEKLIWEVGELDATTRRADVAALKEFVSRQSIDVRRSYGRYATIGAAMASMIGTVNSEEFLADDTGNRRFYVIQLDALDWAYQCLDIDQIWAEAVARYRRGEPWRLMKEESESQAAHNRQYLADGIMGDYIRKFFAVSQDPAHTLTAADVLDHLRLKDVKLTGTDRGLAMDISRAMASLGVKKTRTFNGGRCYVGILPK